MPFSSFIRSFICLLKNKEFIEKNFEEKEENISSITDRENVRRILKRAGIAEHRYRLGLSQILLQRWIDKINFFKIIIQNIMKILT